MTEKRPDRTLGPVHQSFWDGCAAGELRIQHCGACGHRPWPAVEVCDRCGQAALSWAPVSGRGTVLSWCSLVQDYYKGAFPLPHDCLLVELEEGPLFISNPRGFAFDEITPDMPVRVAFLDAEDSAGPFRLPVFERV